MRYLIDCAASIAGAIGWPAIWKWGSRCPTFFIGIAGGFEVTDRDLTAAVEAGLDELGFELVELEQAGNARRPVLRLRIDHRESDALQSNVSLEDCTRVSRALEARLEADPRFPETYVLEVSSPGVERPLVRRRDFQRFAGQEVAIRGTRPLAGRSRKLQGELLGIEGEASFEMIRLRLPDGEELEIPRSEISRANLVFRWGSEGRRS